MFDDLKDLLSKAETKADTATILISGTVGYILDAQLNILGLIEPGICGILFASGSLGIKKSIEDKILKRKTRSALIKKSNEVIKYINENQIDFIEISEIKSKQSLFKSELLSIEKFSAFLEAIVSKL